MSMICNVSVSRIYAFAYNSIMMWRIIEPFLIISYAWSALEVTHTHTSMESFKESCIPAFLHTGKTGYVKFKVAHFGQSVRYMICRRALSQRSEFQIRFIFFVVPTSFFTIFYLFLSLSHFLSYLPPPFCRSFECTRNFAHIGYCVTTAECKVHLYKVYKSQIDMRSLVFSPVTHIVHASDFCTLLLIDNYGNDIGQIASILRITMKWTSLNHSMFCFHNQLYHFGRKFGTRNRTCSFVLGELFGFCLC